MKKLMIAAAVACVGMFANAATCAWSTDWLYAVDTSHSTYDPGGFTGNYWILSGDFSDVSVGAGGVLNASGEYTIVADKVSVSSSDGVGGDFGSALTAADNGTAIAMIVYYNGADGEYWGMDTDVIAGIVDPNPGAGELGKDATAVKFYTIDADGYKSMGATTEVVPEPTSGLLLLLGVAGLALRRRRA